MSLNFLFQNHLEDGETISDFLSCLCLSSKTWVFVVVVSVMISPFQTSVDVVVADNKKPSDDGSITTMLNLINDSKIRHETTVQIRVNELVRRRTEFLFISSFHPHIKSDP